MRYITESGDVLEYEKGTLSRNGKVLGTGSLGFCSPYIQGFDQIPIVKDPVGAKMMLYSEGGIYPSFISDVIVSVE